MRNRQNLLIIFCLTVLFSWPLTSFAIGQLTQPIIINDALRGKEYTEKLTLLNSDKIELTYELKASGQIADWVTFYEKTDIDLKDTITKIQVPPEAYTDATVKFAIPADAANGEYKGEVAVNYTPAVGGNATTSTNLTQSIGRSVTINVSDKEVINLTVSVIPEKFDFLPGESLPIRVIYDNQSNIGLSPQIDLKIKNSEQTVYSAIFPYPDSAPAVKPGTQYEIPSLTIPSAGWANGSYIAALSFFHAGNKIGEEQFTFSVGLVSEADENMPGKTGFIAKYMIWLLWALAAVLAGAIFFLLKKRVAVKSGSKEDFGVKAGNGRKNGNGRKMNGINKKK
ncbi:MAG: hypothetical protein MUC28_04500 [Planctomycetes bacterium]|jgi:hypothetical protein|nr:hypothetical protein [Planctomycetota bacterium]